MTRQVSSGGPLRRVLLAVVSIAFLPAAGACSPHGASGAVQVNVARPTSWVTEPVTVEVSGLHPRQEIELRLTSKDAENVEWRSTAWFRADADGMVDLDESPAVRGDYRGVRPMGLLETLSPPSTDHRTVTYTWSHEATFRLSVRSASGDQLATTDFRRRLAPNVHSTRLDVNGVGFDGNFLRLPTTTGSRPGILAFGGSEGGNSMGLSGLVLAERGYPTLTLAYFHAPGLPQELSRVPVEYFAKAARWLREQPGVDPKRIYVLGVSRGSEAAQLLAIHYPHLVHGLVLGVPSSVVNSGIALGPGGRQRGLRTSAWSFGGEPITPARVYGIPTNDGGAIPLEDFHGPVFAFCGGHDKVWESCAYAQSIKQRLREHRGRAEGFTLAAFPEAGHGLGALVPFVPRSTHCACAEYQGSTRWADQRALAALWPRLLAFLGSPRTPR